jgi:hypothetical protein
MRAASGSMNRTQTLSTLHTDLWRITQPHQALPAINMSPGSSYSNQYLVCMLIHCDNCSTYTYAVIETTILCFREKWTLKPLFLSVLVSFSLSALTRGPIRKWTAFLRITVFWEVLPYSLVHRYHRCWFIIAYLTMLCRRDYRTRMTEKQRDNNIRKGRKLPCSNSR